MGCVVSESGLAERVDAAEALAATVVAKAGELTGRVNASRAQAAVLNAARVDMRFNAAERLIDGARSGAEAALDIVAAARHQARRAAPGQPQLAEEAERAAQHARWLLVVGEEAVERAQQLMDAELDRSQSFSQDSNDDDTTGRKTMSGEWDPGG